MVDPVQLLSDTTALDVFLLMPFAIFGGLFLLGWERDLQGDRMGFGKRTFLLLLVGGLVGGELANLPFFGWNGSILMINIGGGLLPVAISLVVLSRPVLPGGTRDLACFLGGLAVAVAGVLLLLSAAPYAAGLLVLVSLVASLVAGAAVLVLLRRDLLAPGTEGSTSDPLAALALIGVGMAITYLSTQVVADEGIVSAFPFYLIAPVLIGAISVVVRWPRRDAPALAYAASTLGVLIGADVLHQPQLFLTPTFLGSIGGAGLLDLVFLSGPLALGTALAIDLVSRRLTHHPSPVPASGPALAFGPTRGNEARFQPALRAFADGGYAEVAPSVLSTIDQDLRETRSALGLFPAPAERGLEPLHVHPFVSADLANLRQLSMSRSSDREDARRALVAGFLVQRGLRDIFGRRLATLGDRIKAFGLDLLITMVPSAPLLYLVILVANLNVDTALASVPYLAAISAVGAWPYLLWAGLEWRWGVTPGKHLLDLMVVGSEGGRPSLLSALARNVPKLIPLAALSITLGVAVVYAAFFTPLAVGLLLAFIVFGAGLFVTGLTGLATVLTIRSSPRRQRPGDLMGATMVWRRFPPFFPGVTGTAVGTPMAPFPPPAPAPLPSASPIPAVPPLRPPPPPSPLALPGRPTSAG